MDDDKNLIILVDDNLANLQAGKNVLSKKFRVATAPSAEKMFELLENNKPALIILDIDMPEMDGYETIKVLKSKPETKDIPIVFLTAMTDTSNKLEGYSLGATDYITKPFDPEALLKRIEMRLFT